MRDLGPEYARVDDDAFTPRYRASCHCGAVRYEVSADPLDAKICHCRTCQSLHGAPMQWAAIFHKRHVRLTRGIEHLRFYSDALDRAERAAPCAITLRRRGREPSWVAALENARDPRRTRPYRGGRLSDSEQPQLFRNPDFISWLAQPYRSPAMGIDSGAT